MFQRPNRIDVRATRAVPTPATWKDEVPAAEVQVLPLVDENRPRIAGWCTSGADLCDSPEVEVMCGGINTKKASHAALWRQGNLLHFGFQEQPSELNERGRNLLENAIVYIARFGDDRPIAVTPSGFADKTYPRSRTALRHALEAPDVTSAELARHFGGAARTELAAMTPAQAKEWIAENMGFLAAGADGRLAVDPDAKALGVALDDEALFTEAPARAAAGEGEATRAHALLSRRIPDGPGAGASRASWQAFLAAHRDYLFFTETGGYVWLLDPLAQERGVPTAELRGPRRADW